jgi:7,8-dihydropterin-6-yl-methyl-4-(beta-D-ribofuranosyl)aminobenzene 5'-phosphate synthase
LVITIVSDDYGYDPKVRASSGFACLVEIGSLTLLFDTGAYGPTLLHNLGKLGYSAEQIEGIVLSHSHSDHIGGLSEILGRNSHIEVYVPQSFPSSLKERIVLRGAKVIEIAKPVSIYPGVIISGELGEWIKEQALLLRTKKGVVLLVGDAHSGIVSCIKRAQEIAGDKVHLVLGGFHLASDASDDEIQSLTREFRHLGVEKVAPCHSCWDRIRHTFREEYREDYIEAGAGKIISCY